MRARHPVLFASVILVLLTLWLTWPQALHLGTKVAAHQDSYFSTWRLAWVAHALRVDPSHLFDANIFYPERNTLAYSDAMLLEGALAAPLIWVGISPILVYNLMLLAGIASSGIGMFVLALYLTKNFGASLVSAAIFMLVPYRIEHYMHLELQWTVWMPLAFWAVHRAVAEGSWRFGALAGILLWLQALSCVYYGIFLGMIVALLSILLIAARPRQAGRALAVLAVGAAIAIALTYPYARPYIDNARALGPRDMDEVRRFSALPLSYVAAPSQNWLWGWTAARFGRNELHLFPGVVAVGLALVALAHRPRGLVWSYVILCVVAVEVSLGLNGRLYPTLYAYLWPLHGLRAVARFSVVAFCALAVVAGLGVTYLQQWFSTKRARQWVCNGALILVAVEYASAPMSLMDVPTRVPDVYRVVKGLGPVVMAEFPMPEPGSLPGNDPIYSFYSITHWNSLVNGYSGYYPPSYIETLTRCLKFPDDASIRRLRSLNVRYILVHQPLYEAPEFADLMINIGRREELIPAGKYRDWAGHAHLFELKP